MVCVGVGWFFFLKVFVSVLVFEDCVEDEDERKDLGGRGNLGRFI